MHYMPSSQVFTGYATLEHPIRDLWLPCSSCDKLTITVGCGDVYCIPCLEDGFAQFFWNLYDALLTHEEFTQYCMPGDDPCPRSRGCDYCNA